MANILICDDERDIVSALKIYLASEGYTLFEAYTGREALEIAHKHELHLILMDIMMPEMDGISATAKLREECNVPIILLTAKSEYITKPFNPIEVLARVRSQLRRYTTLGGLEQKPSKLVIGGIVLDDETKAVTVDSEPVNLTPIEYNILLLLMRHPGRVYSSAQIYEQVWNETAFGSEGAVAVHIRHLREKLEIDPSNPRYLKVVWGLGYKMEP